MRVRTTSLLTILAMAAAPALRAQDLPRTDRVSLAWDGPESDRKSVDSALSHDGRYVTFRSACERLVPGDTNGQIDIFVRDRVLGLTWRVSESESGEQANGESFTGSISGDGRLVAFSSRASNLVDGDTNLAEDVFVAEWPRRRIHRLDVSATGIEADGRSYQPQLSPDQKYVVFTSAATNLVASDTNGRDDVFLKELSGGAITLVSVSSSGQQGAGLSQHGWPSARGAYVVFASDAPDLVPGDTNHCQDVFLRDCVNGVTTRISEGPAGEGNGPSVQPMITPDGRYIVYQSFATNLVSGDANGTADIFLHDRVAGTTICVSVDSHGVISNDKSGLPSIADDGRTVAFASNGTNLVPGDTNDSRDIFLHDCVANTTLRASVDPVGAEADDGSDHPALSGDGRQVCFHSIATNLVHDDTNGYVDVFVHGPPLAASANPPSLLPGGLADLAERWGLRGGLRILGLAREGPPIWILPARR